MALTQMQLIQSLGEAMSWFERELGWGVPPTELRHLCGRIGELYAAIMTNGQMASEVNQKGYDVVSGDGDRISVKTTAMMNYSGHIAFNPNSLMHVDRVMILRMNTEEMQVEILLDAPIAEAILMMSPSTGGKQNLPLCRLIEKRKPKRDVSTAKEVHFENYTVRELESGTIEIEQNGEIISPVKPALREIAKQLNVGLLNSKGNAFNTRQLGSQIIQSIHELYGLPMPNQSLNPDLCDKAIPAG